MRFLSVCIKRIRFKLIIVVYIIGSLLWGIIQYIDLSVLKTFTMKDVQDIVAMSLQEKKATTPVSKQQLENNKAAFNLPSNVSKVSPNIADMSSSVVLNHVSFFEGSASVTSGVTFKLFTPVAQSWRTHITRSVHLYGVDSCAPRQKAKLNDQEWPCGAVTTAWLVTKTLGQTLSCKQALMHNGVSYAQCFVQGVDLAEAGLAEGMLVLAKETKNPIPVQYRHAEEAARKKKIGLWSSNFTEPSQWRRDHGSYNPFSGF
ncbi:endonuclease YncB(thermonuclease family) [Bartonella silvatica]|uniref:Endonuclease YncB(Thermonuclease family) n=1 Tax=Bartonella silvatica TaxID=357760 RepID=A0ABV2HGC0_9HYPH